MICLWPSHQLGGDPQCTQEFCKIVRNHGNYFRWYILSNHWPFISIKTSHIFELSFVTKTCAKNFLKSLLYLGSSIPLHNSNSILVIKSQIHSSLEQEKIKFISQSFLNRNKVSVKNINHMDKLQSNYLIHITSSFFSLKPTFVDVFWMGLQLHF